MLKNMTLKALWNEERFSGKIIMILLFPIAWLIRLLIVKPLVIFGLMISAD